MVGTVAGKEHKARRRRCAARKRGDVASTVTRRVEEVERAIAKVVEGREAADGERIVLEADLTNFTATVGICCSTNALRNKIGGHPRKVRLKV
jgi:hypothetical protein